MKKHLLTSISTLLALGSFAQIDNYIGSGGMHIEGGTEFTVKDGNLSMDGDVVGSGQIGMRSASNAQSIDADNNSINNLLIDNGDDISLSSALTVGSDLEFVAGDMNIAGFDLTITDGGTFTNASASNKVLTTGNGNLVQTVNTTALEFPVAFAGSDYNPATLAAAGSGNVVSVRVTDDLLQGGNFGAAITADVVDVRWNINNAGSDAIDMTLQWALGQETTDFDRTNEGIGWYEGSGLWDLTTSMLGASAGSGPFTRSRSGVTTSGVFAIGDEESPLITGALPIELLSFDAGLVEDGSVQLDWVTASETNNDFFTIEKSLDGQSWDFVTEVEGAGNSATELTYQTFDPRPYKGVSYYRLKQTDFDGKFSYSDIRSVEVNKGAEISVRPNPTDAVITVAGSGAELSSMTLVNSFGKQIQSYNNELDNKPSEVKIDLSNLSPGVYFLRTATQTKKVVKQ